MNLQGKSALLSYLWYQSFSKVGGRLNKVVFFYIIEKRYQTRKMGVGKIAACQQLKKDLSNSVLLDGDWCCDTSSFQVIDEIKVI